jgi:putative transposase
MEMSKALSPSIGVVAACRLLGIPRSQWYRQQRPPANKVLRRAPPRTLSAEACEQIRTVLNSERFRNQAPRQIYATLLDEGVYYCHWRTMYRILAQHDEVQERRQQRTHPSYTKPELLATAPNQLWGPVGTPDITKLKGEVRLTYYYLYVILDIYSRYVVGWLLDTAESEQSAHKLIAQTCAKQGIIPGQLTLHADRGPSMMAKSVEQLLLDLDVAKSHSRPYTPNDNPFSEAHFKTLKYRPDYPGRFASYEQSAAWAATLFEWYNNHHYHTALKLMTPVSVHYGFESQVRAQRQQVLEQAYRTHPERFVHGVPALQPLPETVWLNPPKAADQ